MQAHQLGEKIRELRLARDLSQEQLGARSGVPAGTISRIESGVTTSPGYSTLGKIATALGFDTVDHMLGLRNTASDAETRFKLAKPDELEPPANRFNAQLVDDTTRDPSVKRLPIYRWGAAGDPRRVESAPDPDRLDYPPLGRESLIGPRGFAVDVKGDSLSKRNIQDGDTVWCNPDAPLRVGRIVVARCWTENEETTGIVVKVWSNRNGREVLHSDSEGKEGSFAADCARFEVIGPVVWVTRGFPPG